MIGFEIHIVCAINGIANPSFVQGQRGGLGCCDGADGRVVGRYDLISATGLPFRDVLLRCFAFSMRDLEDRILASLQFAGNAGAPSPDPGLQDRKPSENPCSDTAQSIDVQSSGQETIVRWSILDRSALPEGRAARASVRGSSAFGTSTIVAQFQRPLPTRQRKLDTRRKVILGGALIDLAARDSTAAEMLDRLLRNLTRENDLQAFEEWSPPSIGSGSRVDAGAGAGANVDSGSGVGAGVASRPGSENSSGPAEASSATPEPPAA